MLITILTTITTVLLSSSERELELPELVVTGRYEARLPVRTLWPLPEARAEYIIYDYETPMPAHTITRRYEKSHASTNRPPSHVSCSLAGGPGSGYLLMNISEPRGGLSFTAWSEPGDRLDRTGMRVTVFGQGEWGRVSASGDRWKDQLDDEEIASGWTAGEISLMLPWGRFQTVSLGAFSTSGADDDIHFEAGYSRAFRPTSARLQLGISDRQAEGLVSWRTPDHRIRVKAGASWLNLDEFEKTWFVGSANVYLLSNSNLSFLLTASRRLGISTRKYLRTQFPLASSTQEALPKAVAWNIALESAFSITPHLRISLRGGTEELSQAPAWREAPDSLHWRAESFSGYGSYGTIQANWSAIHQLDIITRMTAKAYRFDDVPESTQNDTWPLVPKIEWYLGLSTMGRLNARLGMQGIHGMTAIDGDDIDDAVSIRWDLGYRIRKGLRIWSSGSVGSGWDLSPVPNRTVTLGLAWSLIEFSNE